MNEMLELFIQQGYQIEDLNRLKETALQLEEELQKFKDLLNQFQIVVGL